MLRARIKGELRSIASLLGRFTRSSSPPGPRVLCYHGVCPDPVDEWSVTPSQLREQMAIVAGDFVPVTAEAVAGWARGEGSLPDRAVAVTFDDGYADVHDHAAPILAEFGIQGAAFVSPEFSDRAGPVPGVGYEALRPIMGWREVRALRDAGLDDRLARAHPRPALRTSGGGGERRNSWRPGSDFPRGWATT